MSSTAASNPTLPSPGQDALQATNYVLESDLAQYCLPMATADPMRKFAWANSLCAATIAVAISGFLYFPKLEEHKIEDPNDIIPVVFTPPIEPPKVVEEVNEEPQLDPETVVEQVNVATVVAIDPSAAAFAVPVTGPVTFAPAARAQAPPMNVRRSAAPPKTEIFTGIGTPGFPPPPYTFEALKRELEGTCWLAVFVDENGIPTSVKVKISSGFTELDSQAVKWVKTHWRWPVGNARPLEVDIQFKLN